MFQGAIAAEPVTAELTSSELAASRRVSRGIMRALELGELEPGQRIVETKLASRYRVGRNAVREAVQWLSATGVVDLSRYRSASLRLLDPAETLEVLEVAEAILGLLVKAASRRYCTDLHEEILSRVLQEVEQAGAAPPAGFARARRHFYSTLLAIGANRELQRLFPASGLHVLFAQYRAAAPGWARLDDFRAMAAAVANGDTEHAQALGRAHIGRIRAAIDSLAGS